MPRSERYRFHPEAAEEFESAEDWYFSRSVDASAEFLSEVEAGIDAIIRSPRRWPKYLYGTRRYVLQRFPFSIFYLDDPEIVTIVAVAHAKRKPGYWKSRV